MNMGSMHFLTALMYTFIVTSALIWAFHNVSTCVPHQTARNLPSIGILAISMSSTLCNMWGSNSFYDIHIPMNYKMVQLKQDCNQYLLQLKLFLYFRENVFSTFLKIHKAYHYRLFVSGCSKYYRCGFCQFIFQAP